MISKPSSCKISEIDDEEVIIDDCHWATLAMRTDQSETRFTFCRDRKKKFSIKIIQSLNILFVEIFLFVLWKKKEQTLRLKCLN
jgi:hypothetical protein